MTYSYIFDLGEAGAAIRYANTQTQSVDHGTSGTPVTAVPDTDYRFDRWSDGSTQNLRKYESVIVDISVNAVFQFWVDFKGDVEGNGSVGLKNAVIASKILVGAAPRIESIRARTRTAMESSVSANSHSFSGRLREFPDVARSRDSSATAAFPFPDFPEWDAVDPGPCRIPILPLGFYPANMFENFPAFPGLHGEIGCQIEKKKL